MINMLLYHFDEYLDGERDLKRGKVSRVERPVLSKVLNSSSYNQGRISGCDGQTFGIFL